jgi:hypothetical protein
MASDLLSLVTQAEALDSQDTMASWTDTMGEISTRLASLTEVQRQEALARDPHADIDGIEMTLDNPASASYEAAQQMLAEWGSSSTSGRVNLAEYYSHRSAGQSQQAGSYDSSWVNNLATSVLFSNYLFEKMGYYGNLKEGSRLDYQIEYILIGEDTDEKNLKKIKNRIFLWRFADNVRLYFTDSAKKAEAHAIAVATCFLVPELIESVTNGILFAWAYDESKDDLKKLLEGGKVPLIKRSLYSNEGGLEYYQYLGLMLFLQNEDKKLARTMDIMEMDIRLTPGNRNFRIDWCVESFRATVDFRDRYANYAIDRQYGYY